MTECPTKSSVEKPPSDWAVRIGYAVQEITTLPVYFP